MKLPDIPGRIMAQEASPPEKTTNQDASVVESVDGGNKKGEGEAPAASSETDLSDEGILIPGDE